jgi:hypothetical protein
MKTETLKFDLDHLQLQFESSAEWRRTKAAQYPADASRNLAAAADLERLAAGVKHVHADYVRAYGELHEDDNDALRITEIESEMTSAVGFRGDWATAEDFVKEIIAGMTGGR